MNICDNPKMPIVYNKKQILKVTGRDYNNDCIDDKSFIKINENDEDEYKVLFEHDYKKNTTKMRILYRFINHEKKRVCTYLKYIYSYDTMIQPPTNKNYMIVDNFNNIFKNTEIKIGRIKITNVEALNTEYKDYIAEQAKDENFGYDKDGFKRDTMSEERKINLILFKMLYEFRDSIIEKITNVQLKDYIYDYIYDLVNELGRKYLIFYSYELSEEGYINEFNPKSKKIWSYVSSKLKDLISFINKYNYDYNTAKENDKAFKMQYLEMMTFKFLFNKKIQDISEISRFDEYFTESNVHIFLYNIINILKSKQYKPNSILNKNSTTSEAQACIIKTCEEKLLNKYGDFDNHIDNLYNYLYSKLYSKYLEQKYLEQSGGNKKLIKSKQYIKTDMKIQTSKGLRCIYVNKKGIEYVILSGKYVKYKH